MSPKTVSVLQPGYFPWLGFFDLIHRSDVFVYYDDVQFDKHGWRNRNRIKGQNGPQWLTVPVLHKNQNQPIVKDMQIDKRQPWAKKHVKTIQQLYAKSPYTKEYLPVLESILCHEWKYLIDLDLKIAKQICNWLNLECSFQLSSEIGLEGGQSDRLLSICQYFNATTYLSGNAAREYLDVDLFTQNQIQVEWQNFPHPTYTQLHGEFVPYLSSIDLLLNCGCQSEYILKSAKGESPE